MTRIDDEMLAAYADGELNEIDRARVERALAEDDGLCSRLNAQRRLRDRLARHYEPVADEAIPQRFLDLLDTNVVALRTRSSGPRWWQAGAAMAATLVLGLAMGQAVPGGSPVAVERGALIAQGELAQALETQLASSQRQGAPVRIGLTFPGPDGQFCRTFQSTAASGLACRGDEDWRLLVMTTGEPAPAGEYRQAGSETALVMQAAQEIMTGAPLGPEAERRAREAGWD